VINTHYIQLALINSYFDFEDYYDPIKTYLEDLNLITLIPSITKRVIYEVQQNTAELKENLLFNIFSETKEFYNIGRKQSDAENFNLNSQTYAYIFFKLSQISDHYERNVFTLFDMFGLVGGVFGILCSSGSILVSLFSVKLFNNSLLSKIYQIKIDKKAESKTPSKLGTYAANEREFPIEFHKSSVIGEEKKNINDDSYN
jgi:hypothetical protein